MTLSTDAEKAADKNQIPIMTKALRKLGTQENFLNLIKSYLQNTYS